MSKILLVVLLLIAAGQCDFPTDPVKASMFDASNGFIDLMNNYLFQLYSLLQNRFDTSVATIWLYWRSASLSSNSRGFVIAGDNRTVLCDCIGSFDDVVSKLIDHLQNNVLKNIHDIRQTDTKIEDDLSKEFDEHKELIMQISNMTCLKNVGYNDYNIATKYSAYSNFLARSFSDITYKTDADYAARFYLELLAPIRILIEMRSYIMTARTRVQYNQFIRSYCKPQIFAKFENLIEISNNIVTDCSKKIYNALNEALDRLPDPSPFKDKLSACL